MISKKQLLDLMILECNICKKLFKKIPKTKMNYRPGKNMRNTIELLRYISFCGTECTRIFVLDAMKTQNWDPYMAAAEKSKSMKPAQFLKSMDAQIRDIKKLFAGISEKDFANRKVMLFSKKKMPLGEALMHTAVRFMSGYRMQLFLYAKASGNSKLGTKDCW